MLSVLTQVAAKAEGTPGTAESLTATEAVFFAYIEPDAFSPDVSIIDRPSMQGGQHKATHGGRRATITFEVDLAGKGAPGVPYWASVLLPACGGSLSTATYSFGYTVAPITLAVLVDGTVQKIAGAVGTFTINLVTAEHARIRFTFTGKIVDDADTALLAPTYESVVPPRFADGTLTLGGYALRASTFGIDLGATVGLKQDPNGDATGYSSGYISRLLPSMTADPEDDLVATKDWWALVKSMATGALSLVLGDTANNTITIASSAVQVLGAPKGMREGLSIRNLSLRPVWTGASGTSPFTIAFS